MPAAQPYQTKEDALIQQEWARYDASLKQLREMHKVSPDTLNFLSGLEKRLHGYYFFPESPKLGNGPCLGNSFTPTKISTDEFDHLIQVIEKDNLILYPTTTDWGFRPAFQVLYGERPAPGISADVNLLLLFAEYQLPQGYDFKAVKPHFLQPRNKRLVKALGLKRIDERDVMYMY